MNEQLGISLNQSYVQGFLYGKKQQVNSLEVGNSIQISFNGCFGGRSSTKHGMQILESI